MTQQTGDSPAGPPAAGGGAGLRLVALAAGFVMAAVDATVVNVAGPPLQHGLRLTLSQLTWVVDGYTLAFAALMLLSGSLADRFGAKRLYLSGMAVFLLASLACAAAPSGGALVAARLVQGLGAALSVPTSLTLLTASFPDPGRRARMVALWASVVSGAMALGPIVGGVLISAWGWRSIFLLNLPVGVAGLVLAARLLPQLPGRVARPAWGGHTAGAATLALLCFVLIQGPVLGWGSPRIVTAAVGFVLAGLGFVRHLSRSSVPVLPASLFRDATFTSANMIGFLLNAGAYGGLYLLGLFVQAARGADALHAGLDLIPATGVFVIGNLSTARLLPRVGARRLVMAGIATAGVASLLSSLVTPGMPYALLAGLVALGNLGIGLAVPAVMAALVNAAGAERANPAAATMNATRQVGTLVGVALTAIVLAASGSHWYTAASWYFAIVGVAFLAGLGLAARFLRPG
ncbi:MFS transporter [Streptacidiphilus sp. MAP12-33]|uniref:MFS transporter n=1 Tax=Streptacidiphilus sp. MAP12-33 TaxID=3156266 RepID=UPI0035110E18